MSTYRIPPRGPAMSSQQPIRNPSQKVLLVDNMNRMDNDTIASPAPYYQAVNTQTAMQHCPPPSEVHSSYVHEQQSSPRVRHRPPPPDRSYSLPPATAEDRAMSRTNAVPLSLLQRFPAYVECPACQKLTPTSTKHVAGKGTHGMAVMFFFLTGVLFFVPYVSNTFKDVKHSCLRCGRELATAHFGNTTEAHLMG